MGLKISIDERKPGTVTIQLSGSIDTDTYLELKKRLASVTEKTVATVLMDMKDVEYISSVGLGVVFGFQRTLKDKNGQLMLCNLKPHIRKVFEIVKALPLESIFTSVKEADEYLDKIMRQEKDKQSGRS